MSGKSAGATGTQESSTAGAAVLPSETTPSAADYRKAEADLQRDDDKRRATHGDFAAQQLADRDEHWAQTAKDVKRPDEFLPSDKVTVVLPEGHPNRVE